MQTLLKVYLYFTSVDRWTKSIYIYTIVNKRKKEGHPESSAQQSTFCLVYIPRFQHVWPDRKALIPLLPHSLLTASACHAWIHSLPLLLYAVGQKARVSKNYRVFCVFSVRAPINKRAVLAHTSPCRLPPCALCRQLAVRHHTNNG